MKQPKTYAIICSGKGSKNIQPDKRIPCKLHLAGDSSLFVTVEHPSGWYCLIYLRPAICKCNRQYICNNRFIKRIQMFQFNHLFPSGKSRKNLPSESLSPRVFFFAPFLLKLKCRKGFTNSDFSDKIKGDTVYICLYLCINNFCGKIIGFSADY